MADLNAGRVVWVLDAENGEYLGKLDESERAAKSSFKSIDDAGARTARSLGDVFDSLGKTLTSSLSAGANIATAAIVSLGVKGVTSGNQLQSLQISMNGLTKSMQLGAQAMAGAYKYAQKAPFQLPEVAGVTKTLIAYGMSVKDSVDALETLGNVSITTGVDIQSLGSIFGRISASGKIMNGDITQLTENGIAILPQLQKQFGKTADEVRSMAEKGQISFGEFRKALDSLVDPSILDQLQNTLPRQLDRLNGSLRILSGSFVGYSVDAVTGFKAGNVAIITSVTELVKNVANTLRAPALLDAANRAGQAFVPLIDAISSFFKVTGEGANQTSPAIRLLTSFFDIIAKLGPLLVPILVLMSLKFANLFSQIPVLGELLGGLGEAFNDLTASIGNLAKNSADLTIGGIGRAISNIPETTVAATKSIVAFGKTSKTVFDKTKDIIDSLVNIIRPSFSGLGDEVRSAFGKISQNISNALLDSSITFTVIRDGFRKSLSETVGVVNNYLDVITSRISNFSSSVQDRLGNFLSPAVAKIKSGLDNIRSFFDPFASAVNRAIDSVSERLRGFGDSIESAVSNISARVQAVATSLSEKVGNIVSTITTQTQVIASNISNNFNAAVNTVQGFIDGIQSRLGSFVNSVKEIGGRVSDFFDPFINAVEGIAGKVAKPIDTFRGFLVKKFSEIRTDISNAADNLTSPLENSFKKAADALGVLGERFKAYAGPIGDTLSALGSSIGNRFSSAFSSVIDKVGPKLSGLPGQIQKVAGELSGPLNSLFDGIGGAIGRIGGIVGNVASSLAGPLINGVIAVGSAAATMGPEFGKAVDDIINKIINDGPKMAQAFLENINKMIQSIVNNAPALTSAFSTIITTVAQFIVQNGPTLIQAFTTTIVTLIKSIATPQNITLLVSAAITLFTSIVSGLAQVLPALLTAVLNVILELIKQFSDPKTLTNLINTVVNMMVKILDALIIALPQIINGLVQFLIQFINVITRPDILDRLIQSTVTLITVIVVALINNLPKLIDAGIKLVFALANALTRPENINAILGGIGKIISAIWNALTKTDWFRIGGDIVRGLWEGISNMGAWIGQKIKGFGDGIMKSLKDFFKIKSPSRLMRDDIGKNLGLGIALGITQSTKYAVDAATDASNQVMDAMQGMSAQSSELKTSYSLSNQMTPDVVGVQYSQQEQRSSAYNDPRQPGVVINQTNTVNTPLDMNQVNRNLAWELNKR